jgi:hypothetical protein
MSRRYLRNPPILQQGYLRIGGGGGIRWDILGASRRGDAGKAGLPSLGQKQRNIIPRLEEIEELRANEAFFIL